MKAPGKDEYAEFHNGYISLVAESDVLKVLWSQPKALSDLLGEISDEYAERPYAEGKWTLKELLGHIIDTERIFAYRTLRFSRGDRTPLQGFDQDPYVENSRSNERALTSLLDEFETVRRANMFLLEELNENDLERRGEASGAEVTVRALVYLLAGHAAHHLNILRERYL